VLFCALHMHVNTLSYGFLLLASGVTSNLGNLPLHSLKKITLLQKMLPDSTSLHMLSLFLCVTNSVYISFLHTMLPSKVRIILVYEEGLSFSNFQQGMVARLCPFMCRIYCSLMVNSRNMYARFTCALNKKGTN